MKIPTQCVVDTNVCTTANGRNAGAPSACVVASAAALVEVMKNGHVFVDDKWRIQKEYEKHLCRSGEPGVGDRFFRWLVDNYYVRMKVTQVVITPKSMDEEDYEELPPPSNALKYDPSDRKFLAVAASHRDKPPILQAYDSKWVGWQSELAKAGVAIIFLCPKEIEQKYKEKMCK